MSSRPDEMPELWTFYLNPDECFKLIKYTTKRIDLCYADANEKLRVKFTV
jgi:hypothetical protein